MILAVSTLAGREVVRFVRQRSRLIGALAQPLLFWVLLGAGLSGSFRAGSAGYTEYFFPGVLSLTILFSAIFSTISVVEDRNSGFLQGVLVSPASRTAIVLGQAVGSTILATGQSVLILPLAPLAGIHPGPRSIALVVGVLVLTGLSLSGLGLILAWTMRSTQGFHAIMNLVLLPMWLLSGAFFPVEGAATWLGRAMSVNPMTYAVAALRRALYLDARAGTAGLGHLPSLPVSLGVVMLCGAAALLVATLQARRAS